MPKVNAKERKEERKKRLKDEFTACYEAFCEARQIAKKQRKKTTKRARISSSSSSSSSSTKSSDYSSSSSCLSHSSADKTEKKSQIKQKNTKNSPENTSNTGKNETNVKSDKIEKKDVKTINKKKIKKVIASQKSPTVDLVRVKDKSPSKSPPLVSKHADVGESSKNDTNLDKPDLRETLTKKRDKDGEYVIDLNISEKEKMEISMDINDEKSKIQSVDQPRKIDSKKQLESTNQPKLVDMKRQSESTDAPKMIDTKRQSEGVFSEMLLEKDKLTPSEEETKRIKDFITKRSPEFFRTLHLINYPNKKYKTCHFYNFSSCNKPDFHFDSRQTGLIHACAICDHFRVTSFHTARQCLLRNNTKE